MFRWQNAVGVSIGLAVGLFIVGFMGSPAAEPMPSGPILSECDGHLRDVVIQYEPAASNVVSQAYRDFLGALEPDVVVHVVCPTQAAFDEIASVAGPVKCRLSPIVVNHPMTTWSRDRWVALTPATAGSVTTLWSPRGETAEEIWPARAGDERIGSDIAMALSPTVRARRSELYFDGGDFLADSEHVFIVPRVLGRNLQHTVTSTAEFLKAAASELKRPVVLLRQAPDHHAGMFMVSIGKRRMLVGDPGLGRKLVPVQLSAGVELEQFMGLPGGPDFSAETQRLFDAVAAQCAEAGYAVTRIPVVPARDGRTYLTYVNVLLDQQGERRIVYLPFYRGAEALNAEARKVWESLGYEIRPVDCTSTYRHFGCLHCLVNVVSRA